LKDQEASQANPQRLPSGGGLDWWSAASAIASGFAAVLIAIWAGFQWAAMNKQRAAMHAQARHMNEMLQAVQQAAEAAVCSARCAEKSLNVAIDKQRARMEATPSLGNTEQPAESVSVSVRIRNTGDTDAIGVKSKGTCDLSGRSNAPKEPSDWHHSNRIEPGHEDSLDIFPMPSLSQEELDAVKRGKQTLTVTVKTEFTDVFGIKRYLHATYRMEAIPSDRSGVPRFNWILNPKRSFESEARDHAVVKTTPTRQVTESESLLKL